MSVAVRFTVPSKNRTGSEEKLSVAPPPSALPPSWSGLLHEQLLSLGFWSGVMLLSPTIPLPAPALVCGLPEASNQSPAPPKSSAAEMLESNAVAGGKSGPDSGGSGFPVTVTDVVGLAVLPPSSLMLTVTVAPESAVV